jgi:polyisoprenoid-binding protein YceI
MRLSILSLAAIVLLSLPSRAQVPVFKTTPEDSAIKFYVKASVALVGKFDKWDATLKFTSSDVTTGVLDIKIAAATVNTGSGVKDGKLKSKDFFNVEQDPTSNFGQRRSCRLARILLTSWGIFPYEGSLDLRR